MASRFHMHLDKSSNWVRRTCIAMLILLVVLISWIARESYHLRSEQEAIDFLIANFEPMVNVDGVLPASVRELY